MDGIKLWHLFFLPSLVKLRSFLFVTDFDLSGLLHFYVWYTIPVVPSSLAIHSFDWITQDKSRHIYPSVRVSAVRSHMKRNGLCAKNQLPLSILFPAPNKRQQIAKGTKTIRPRRKWKRYKSGAMESAGERFDSSFHGNQDGYWLRLWEEPRKRVNSMYLCRLGNHDLALMLNGPASTDDWQLTYQAATIKAYKTFSFGIGIRKNMWVNILSERFNMIHTTTLDREMRTCLSPEYPVPSFQSQPLASCLRHGNGFVILMFLVSFVSVGFGRGFYLSQFVPAI